MKIDADPLPARLIQAHGWAAALLVLAASFPGAALACARIFDRPYGLELSYSEIFHAQIETLRTFDVGEDREGVVAGYRLIESFRGSPPSSGEVVQTRHRDFSTSCDSRILWELAEGDHVVLYVWVSDETPPRRFPGVDSAHLRNDANASLTIDRLRKFKSEQP
ncbi:hypothetical protein E2F46_07435 [Luteimonas aestuarii]|uniref:Uncharacterized protein n=1 Tax=Luteimonas aestuarii TaxID=453837 RepID=A0A4R5TV81_9GAMM|nr:hypothetical protein [Luteimonas aestuarii]TDK24997.1 hypothetical protein E2F46_07435 [Luteimonas aestuarii]